jgi:NitT/TauT family transport system substrate-binding protein
MVILRAVPTGRRAFLGAAAATVAAACIPQGSSIATPGPSLGPPETTAIRINYQIGCDPWTWLADDFLKAEGFTDVSVLNDPAVYVDAVAKGVADLDVAFGIAVVASVDAGQPVIALAGTHTGCFELWARPGINSFRDLRGKRLVVDKRDVLADGYYAMWVGFLASYGVDPSEVQFAEISDPTHTNIDHFLDGRSDAILANVTEGPALRANPNTPGRQIFDMSVDKPWSQYYCCVLVANRDWTRAHPNATRRATRAVLRAIDYGAKDRPRAVAVATEKKIPEDVSLLYEAIKNLNYNWRDYDPEDTLRYYALRLADVKLLKKTPSQIIAEGTDFAFFRQMQRELAVTGR